MSQPAAVEEAAGEWARARRQASAPGDEDDVADDRAAGARALPKYALYNASGQLQHFISASLISDSYDPAYHVIVILYSRMTTGGQLVWPLLLLSTKKFTKIISFIVVLVITLLQTIGNRLFLIYSSVLVLILFFLYSSSS